MSKVITSPVKRFPGTVVISDPLTFPQVFAFGDALNAVDALGENPTILHVRATQLPGVLACVEEWKLENFPSNVTVDSFPATPPKSCAQLIAWLIGEISTLFREAEEIPNA